MREDGRPTQARPCRASGGDGADLRIACSAGLGLPFWIVLGSGAYDRPLHAPVGEVVALVVALLARRNDQAGRGLGQFCNGTATLYKQYMRTRANNPNTFRGSIHGPALLAMRVESAKVCDMLSNALGRNMLKRIWAKVLARFFTRFLAWLLRRNDSVQEFQGK